MSEDDTFFDFSEAEQKTKPVWKWTTGVVDTNKDHFKLWHGKRSRQDSKGRIYQYAKTPVALLARGPGKSFVVQFLLTASSTDKRVAEALKDVRRELDFYLIELSTPDRPAPWAYAQYHCSTLANFYSTIHWAWCPKAAKRAGSEHR